MDGGEFANGRGGVRTELWGVGESALGKGTGGVREWRFYSGFPYETEVTEPGGEGLDLGRQEAPPLNP